MEARQLMSKNLQHYYLKQTDEEVLAELVRLLRGAERTAQFAKSEVEKEVALSAHSLCCKFIAIPTVNDRRPFCNNLRS